MVSQSFYGIHQDLMKNIIMAGQENYPGLRLFPAVNGLFYTKNNVPVKVGTNGMPDLHGWVNSLALYVEVKSGAARIKKGSAQDKFRSLCKKHNIIHIEATSVDQFLGEMNAILRNTK